MRFGLIVVWSVTLLSAQTSPSAQDKCRLEGQVVNSVTDEPVRKAHVTMMLMSGGRIGSGQPPGMLGAVTDAAGRFVFANLDAGSYSLSARHDDFQYQSYRRKGRGPLFESLALAPGDDKRDVVIPLTPLGAISGRVVDEDGDPIRQVWVGLMAYQYNSGHRELEQRYGVPTNDLGEYRLFGVAHGRYYLKAGAQQMMMEFGGSGADESYADCYYSGSADLASAAMVELAAGQQMRGVDFILHNVHRPAIRGRVIKPVGGSFLQIGLIMPNGGGMSTGVNDRDGKFEMHGVAPGSYILTSQTMVGEKKFSARQPIQLGSTDVEGIELHLMPSMEIAGRIHIEGKTEMKPQQVTLSLETKVRGFNPGGGSVKEDGTFRFKDLEPDVYYVSTYNLGSLYLKAVHWGDADATESGIDLTGGVADGELRVVLSAAMAGVEGSVENDKSHPVADAIVTLVPAKASRGWAVNSVATTDAKGHFSFPGTVPGRYKLYAWDGADEPGSLYDPEFLQPFESMGQIVDIAENSKESVHLKVIHNPASE